MEYCYELTKEHYWLDDGNDSYFSRPYRKGKVYCDEEFGSIKLKERTIFTNRGHFHSSSLTIVSKRGLL